MKRIMMMLLSVAVLFGTAGAQGDAQQDTMGGQDFDIESIQPIGTVEVDQQANEAANADPQRGAIVLTHTTPDQQHANFDVVGPNGYYEHFDFEDAAEGQRVLENLEPGVYSVAATDEGLSLAHTVVEVTAGQVSNVSATLEAWDAAAAQETLDAYDPADTYGRNDAMGDDAWPGYPYGAYTVGNDPYDANPEAGAITVDGMENDARLVVTGPDGYSEEIGNGDTLENLPSGQYVLAASGDGTDTSVTTVEVQAGEILSVDPNFQAYAGQGGQQNGAQQDGAQQDGDNAVENAVDEAEQEAEETADETQDAVDGDGAQQDGANEGN